MKTAVRHPASTRRCSTRARLSMISLCLALFGEMVTGCTVPADLAPYEYDGVDARIEADVTALGTATSDAAHPGCEGYLTRATAFAATQSGLVVAYDDRGIALCIDTLDAVATELDETDRNDTADRLRRSYARWVNAHTLCSGDPNPQPSKGSNTEFPGLDQPTGPVSGDPSPQPSREQYTGEEGLGDPSPQPSDSAAND